LWPAPTTTTRPTVRFRDVPESPPPRQASHPLAAPGALIAYAWLATSRSLIVGATTATAALSATAVGPLANGDAARFAALSAALALVAAAVLAGAGLLRLGSVSDFVSKPVMTGFLFGVGLTIAIEQLPKMFGVADAGGEFFERLWALIGDLDDTHLRTAAVGLGASRCSSPSAGSPPRCRRRLSCSASRSRSPGCWSSATAASRSWESCRRRFRIRCCPTSHGPTSSTCSRPRSA